MDEYIKGAFFGALIICIVCMMFPKDKTCAVTIKYGNGNTNVSYVTVGSYDED